MLLCCQYSTHFPPQMDLEEGRSTHKKKRVNKYISLFNPIIIFEYSTEFRSTWEREGEREATQRNKKNMCDRNGFSVSNSAFSLFRPFLVAAKSIIRMPLFVPILSLLLLNCDQYPIADKHLCCEALLRQKHFKLRWNARARWKQLKLLILLLWVRLKCFFQR